jgi:hypothetical protein
MSKQRFSFKDQDGKSSTTGWVVFAYNHLYQRRQFATDGVRYFYQPTLRDDFIIVGESELPPKCERRPQQCQKLNAQPFRLTATVANTSQPRNRQVSPQPRLQ